MEYSKNTANEKKNWNTFIPDRSPPADLAFVVYIPRGIPQENFFPKLSICVGQKLTRFENLAAAFNLCRT